MLWRNLKFLHMWTNFRILHICQVDKSEISPHDRCGLFSHVSTSVMYTYISICNSEISPHDRFFSTYSICDIWDKYQVWAKVIASEQNLLPIQISNWPHHHRHHHHHHWDSHNGHLHDALLWELQAGHKRRLDRQQEGASLVCAQSVLFLILNH